MLLRQRRRRRLGARTRILTHGRRESDGLGNSAVARLDEAFQGLDRRRTVLGTEPLG